VTQEPQVSTCLLSSLDSVERRLVPPFRQLFVNADAAMGSFGDGDLSTVTNANQDRWGDDGQRLKPAPIRTDPPADTGVGVLTPSQTTPRPPPQPIARCVAELWVGSAAHSRFNQTTGAK
jgi:hypothetical protein